jgi:hypothetical protein
MPRPLNRRRASPRIAIAFVAATCASPALALPTTVVVTPATSSWAFIQETPTASGQFVTGPGTPPAGSGSAQFTTGASGGGILLATPTLSGRPLATIGTLAYDSYIVSSANPAASVTLQIDIDYDAADASSDFQGRLVFEPYYLVNSQVAGQWVTWNATAATTAAWWSTGTPIVGGAAQAKLCTQAAPCTWTQVLASYPNARVRNLVGAVGLKVGNFGGAAVMNADRLVFGTTTYDFEAGTPPIPATCGGFIDVAPTDIFCNQVEWMKNRAITLGCAATEYCPGDNVSRAQMALFMQRLGVAVSPLPELTQQATGTLDPDPYAVVCATPDVPVASYPRTAVNVWAFNAALAGSAAFTVYPLVSTDGGANWSVYANGSAIGTPGGIVNGAGTANYAIAPGAAAKFALGIIRAGGAGGGTADFATTLCQLNRLLVNSNPTTAPFDATPVQPFAGFLPK